MNIKTAYGSLGIEDLYVQLQINELIIKVSIRLQSNRKKWMAIFTISI